MPILLIRIAGSCNACLRVPHAAISCGLALAMLGTSLAIAWWAGGSTSPTRVLRLPAGTAGTVSITSCYVLFVAVMCVLAAAYRGLARIFPVLMRDNVACGAAYGLVMCMLLSSAILPALTGHPLHDPPAWTATCMSAHLSPACF
jgi:hypothetical protein